VICKGQCSLHIKQTYLQLTAMSYQMILKIAKKKEKIFFQLEKCRYTSFPLIACEYNVPERQKSTFCYIRSVQNKNLTRLEWLQNIVLKQQYNYIYECIPYRCRVYLDIDVPITMASLLPEDWDRIIDAIIVEVIRRYYNTNNKEHEPAIVTLIADREDKISRHKIINNFVFHFSDNENKKHDRTSIKEFYQLLLVEWKKDERFANVDIEHILDTSVANYGQGYSIRMLYIRCMDTRSRRF